MQQNGAFFVGCIAMPLQLTNAKAKFYFTLRFFCADKISLSVQP